MGNKEYCYRGGKIRKVHRKRHNQSMIVKCLNYSGPLPTIQECGDSTLCHESYLAGGAKMGMPSTSGVLGLALFGSAWLILVFTGCGGPQMQQTDANGAWALSQPPKSIGERQLDPLLVQVSQLQVVSQESLDAAKAIGTPDHKLIAARHDSASAEQLLQDGQAAFRAKQYELSWDKLRAADAAFRRAEEAAVRAGLGQLEEELLADYGRLLNSDARSGRRIVSVARVGKGSLNLRDGAGAHFPVIGTAQSGDTLTILTELGEWYRVRTGTGLVGWVSKMLVTQVQRP